MLAALALPGLLPANGYAEDDQVDFGYQYYEEGARARVIASDLPDTTGPHTTKKPITVESISGKTRVSLTDRIKFAFNYVQDTWGGATPIISGPLVSMGQDAISGASGFFRPSAFSLDKQGNFIGERYLSGIKDNRITHVFVGASPETRQQADFKLSYEWDDNALGFGGGVSEEPDYHSLFINSNARMDFNQKRTSANLGLSYTSSDIGTSGSRIGRVIERTPYGHASGDGTVDNPLKADRQDVGINLSISQILTKSTVLQGGMSFTHNNGFLENPYKAVALYSVADAVAGNPLRVVREEDVWEKRPDARNQFTWNIGMVQHIHPLDAALHVDYSFFHDDWGINAHTFAGAWDQPIGWGWTLTTRMRYYSQTAADFYQPYFLLGANAFVYDRSKPSGYQLDFSKLPIQNFSSDQRLSGFGTLSGGLSINKYFAKGLNLAISGEYYQHAGSLILDGKGEKAFADFDYFTVNATLNVNLEALSLAKGSGGSTASHHHHAHGNHAPAGVMFDHVLDKAGDAMVGYRYVHSVERGETLHGTDSVGDQAIIANGCPGTTGCRFTPTRMSMNMHMLEAMVAPTDWLTLMLMPQFMDMDMNLRGLENAPPAPSDGSGHNHSTSSSGHRTAGIGDTGVYALFKLFNHPTHHLKMGLGFSAPTGSINEKMQGKVGDSGSSERQFLHYGMQLGSGTWDLKPSITYTGQLDEWSWGAQLNGTKRLQDRNDSGYALGDIFQFTAWGGYQLFNWLGSSVRGVYTEQDRIKNQFNTHKESKSFPVTVHVDHDADGDGNSIDSNGVFDPDDVEQNTEQRVVNVANEVSGSMDAPTSYGGRYFDVGFGLNATIPNGSLAGNRLSVEWLQPVHTDVNGYQLDRDGTLNFTWAYGF
ncbi:hypothetical protein JCM14076_17700 [Methylosoma difficile]